MRTTPFFGGRLFCNKPILSNGSGESRGCVYIQIYVRRSKLNSHGEVMASLHKAPCRYTQSQHPFHAAPTGDLPPASSTQHQPAAPSKRHPAGAWGVACVARVLPHVDQHGTACEQIAEHIANPCGRLFGLRHDARIN